MSLKLTNELVAILGKRVVRVENDAPDKAMDTIHLDSKRLVINPTSQGPYRVEIWGSNPRPRVIAVSTRADAENTPYPSPDKLVNTIGI